MKIKTVVVISGTGVKRYEVGESINNLKIDRIDCNTTEFPDAFEHMYAGWTANHELIFEIINAPITVEYEAAKMSDIEEVSDLYKAEVIASEKMEERIAELEALLREADKHVIWMRDKDLKDKISKALEAAK